MRDILPNQLFDNIQNHLIKRANEAEEGWEAGREEEDTLTGHLGAKLQKRWSRPIRLNGHMWKWCITYRKFRGRGPGALEKQCGADGIVQIEVLQQGSGQIIQKSILFQAKKGDIKQSKGLDNQVRKMERRAPQGSAIFSYDESGYRAISGNEYLQKIKDRAIIPREPNHTLGDLLGEYFLACKIGIHGMYYDAQRRRLIVPEDRRNQIILLNLGYRISIDVTRT